MSYERMDACIRLTEDERIDRYNHAVFAHNEKSRELAKMIHNQREKEARVARIENDGALNTHLIQRSLPVRMARSNRNALKIAKRRSDELHAKKKRLRAAEKRGDAIMRVEEAAHELGRALRGYLDEFPEKTFKESVLTAIVNPVIDGYLPSTATGGSSPGTGS